VSEKESGGSGVGESWAYARKEEEPVCWTRQASDRERL